MYYLQLFIAGRNRPEIRPVESLEAGMHLMRRIACPAATEHASAWFTADIDGTGRVCLHWSRPTREAHRWVRKGQVCDHKPVGQRGWKADTYRLPLTDAELSAPPSIPGLQTMLLVNEAHLRDQIADGLAEGNDRRAEVAALTA